MTKRGYPDWGDNLGQTTIVNHDLNELASRLGSISRLERSGSVLWFDDGEQGLYPYTLSEPATVSIYRKPHIGCISGNGIYMQMGAVQTAVGAITINIPYSRFTLFGIEWLFDATCQTPGTWPYMQMDISMYFNNRVWLYSFFVDYQNQRVAINKDNPGGFDTVYFFQPLEPGYPYINAGKWNHCKMIFDPVNDRYQSIVLNGNYKDLSQYLVTSSKINQRNRIEVMFTSWSGSGAYTHKFTDIIVTIDEIYRKE